MRKRIILRKNLIFGLFILVCAVVLTQCSLEGFNSSETESLPGTLAEDASRTATSQTGQRYALIVAGSDYYYKSPLPWELMVPTTMFKDAAQSFYKVITEDHGYKPENVYFFTQTFEAEGQRRDAAGNIMWSNWANIQWALNQIAAKSTPNDEVIIWWFAHGYYGGTCFSIETNGFFSATPSAFEINVLLNKIKCYSMYIFLQACHSGAVIDTPAPGNFKGDNRIIFTSSKQDQTTYSLTYIDKLRSALDRFEANDYTIPADHDVGNNDGRASLKEIWDYTQQPILRSSYNSDPQRYVGAKFAPSGDSVFINGTPDWQPFIPTYTIQADTYASAYYNGSDYARAGGMGGAKLTFLMGGGFEYKTEFTLTCYGYSAYFSYPGGWIKSNGSYSKTWSSGNCYIEGGGNSTIHLYNLKFYRK